MIPGRQSEARSEQGVTLIELLSAMAILSILILVLSTMLDASLRGFRRGAETVEQRGDARVAIDWMERDLASAFASRPAPLPRLPEDTSAVQRGFFEGRLFFPFEIDRQSGSGNATETSFPNAAPGFSTLAFVNRVTSGENDLRGSAPGIVGYYVAFARHSPLADDEGAGMKLFRHHRPGGHPEGERYADSFLVRASRAINDDEKGSTRPLDAPNTAAVRRGRFANSAFPFLLAGREKRDDPGSVLPAVAPWPLRPVVSRLSSPPPTYQPDRGSAADWENPASPVHDSVFPDEPICDHVVRFELRPSRRVALPSGITERLDAAALNAHLGFSGEEWPALVAPDEIEIVLTVIDEGTARRFTRYEDWLIDWEKIESPSATTDDRAILAASRTFRHRFAVPAQP